jgi:hypothetical protein
MKQRLAADEMADAAVARARHSWMKQRLAVDERGGGSASARCVLA